MSVISLRQAIAENEVLQAERLKQHEETVRAEPEPPPKAANDNDPDSKIPYGEIFASQEIAMWNGCSLDAASKAAHAIGNLVSCNLLVYRRGEEHVESTFKDREVDSTHLIDVQLSFASGVAEHITRADIFKRYDAAASETKPPPLPTAPKHHTDPFNLGAPGGILTDIASWIYGTSPSPIADFSVMSAVAVLAGLHGRRVLTPDGLGLNLYIALVAGSGFGKDRPLKAPKQITESIGRGYLVNQSDIASDSAIELMLRQSPCLVLALDELGIMLSASGRGSDAHARARRKAILELYSSATSSWVAKIRASDWANGKSPKPPIQWPTVSFLGATTPSTFYEGLEEDAFRSGFAARLLVVTVETAPALQRVSGFQEVPESLIDKLDDSMESAYPGANGLTEAVLRDSTLKPTYTTAKWSDEHATNTLEAIRLWARDIGIADERRGQIVNRAGDHTSKLATIRAISRDPADPTVEVEDIEWAFAIVWRSIQTVEDGAERFMSGSPFEALCKAIVEAVRQCKDSRGLKHSDLLRKKGVGQAEPRLISAALTRLLPETGQLKNLGLGPPGKGARYVLA
jgi:hypothetical protein